MAWDNSNTTYELGVSSSVFNVIRFAVTAVLLASVSQFLLDWLLSETRIRILANGRDVHLSGGPGFRFTRTSGSGVSRRRLHIILVLLIYIAEVAIEFGSGSTTKIVPVLTEKTVLSRTAIQNVPKICISREEIFHIRDIGQRIRSCTEMADFATEWTYTAKRTEIVSNSSRYQLVCPGEAVTEISATVVLYPSERRVNLTKDFFYRKVHRGGPSKGSIISSTVSGPRESLVHAHISSIGTRMAFPNMQLSNRTRQHALVFMDVTLDVSNASGRIFCDPGCLTKQTRCTFFHSCIMIFQDKPDLLAHGAMFSSIVDASKRYRSQSSRRQTRAKDWQTIVKRQFKQLLELHKIETVHLISNRTQLAFLPADLIQVQGIQFEEYPVLLSMIFPAIRRYRARGSIISRYLTFLAVNGRYEFPATTRHIATDVKQQEQGTIGPIFVGGVALYALIIIVCAVLALWLRARNSEVGISWFTGESRFMAQWADSETGRGNSLAPSGSVVARLGMRKGRRYLSVVENRMSTVPFTHSSSEDNTLASFN